MNRLIVEEDKTLARDTINNSIVNTNRKQYEEYCEQKARALTSKMKIDTMQKEIDELKTLVHQLIKDKTK